MKKRENNSSFLIRNLIVVGIAILAIFLIISLVWLSSQEVLSQPLAAIHQPGSELETCVWPEDQIPVFPDTAPYRHLYKSSSHLPDEKDITCTYALGTNNDAETVLSWYKIEMVKRGWKECDFPYYPEGLSPEYQHLVFGKKIGDRYGMFDVSVSGHGPALEAELFGKNALDLFYDLWTTPGRCELEEPEVPAKPQPVIGEGCRAYHDIPPSDVSCDDSAEKIAERTEIKARIKAKTGIEIVDSDLCDEENPPWGKETLLILEEALNKLPACFLKRAPVGRISGLMSGDVGGLQGLINQAHKKSCQITMQYKDRVGCSMGGYLFLDNNITLCDEHWKITKSPLLSPQEIIIHELNHAFQQYGAVPPTHRKLPNGAYTNPVMIAWLKETGWSPDGICIPFFGCPGVSFELPPDLPTEYARKTRDPKEDMAESVRLYVTDPTSLIEVSPRRYNFVRDKIMCGKEFYE